MAFVSTKLSFIGGPSSGPRLFAYSSADTAATIDTSGYFNAAANVLNVGDIILVYSGVGGTKAFGFTPVLSNTFSQTTLTGVVDTGDATVIAVTNTD
jgi:hypothetical protein